MNDPTVPDDDRAFAASAAVALAGIAQLCEVPWQYDRDNQPLIRVEDVMLLLNQVAL